MISVSRRSFLHSTAAVAVIRPARTPIICSLEESRRAFEGTVPFGGTLVEAGVGYAPDHLQWLRFWGISIGEPREVKGPAWVRFDWPIPATIRDFGRVCPVSGGAVIARFDGMPVAIRRGPLVVLGWPIGPHLYAGDPEAQDLFRALVQKAK